MLKAVLGRFEKAGVTPKRKLLEFRVTEDALLPVGTRLNAAHFVPGQYVDVQATRLASTDYRSTCVCCCVWGELEN